MRRRIASILRHFGGFLPDELYLRLMYRAERGEKLHLQHPELFQEKIQWLKLNNRRPEYTAMVDKLEVKDFVAAKIGGEYVIPTLAVWESPDDIEPDKLPQQFVLKTTHGGGSMGVVVCKDKTAFDLERTKQILEKSFSSNIYKTHREWPYKNVCPRVMAEQYVEMPGKEDLSDYKIYCFNGEPRYIQLIQDRHSGETIDFYDTSWVRQEFIGLNSSAKHATEAADCPPNLDEMLTIARKLSENIPFVRVDLYNIKGQVLFGELTFYPASGFGQFYPEKWNRILGDMLKI